jgi:hypothetical protein
MGRGRQKAKQTKVARELKYMSPTTDYRALEAELSSRSHRDVVTDTPPDAEDEDLWERWADGEDDEEN